MAVNLFVYGVLQSDAITLALTGKTFAKVPASLKDFELCAISSRVNPGIVESKDKVTNGYLLMSVDDESLKIIKAWNGADFNKTSVQVATSFGVCEADAYIWTGQQELNGEWSYDNFITEHLEDYIHKVIPAELAEIKSVV